MRRYHPIRGDLQDSSSSECGVAKNLADMIDDDVASGTQFTNHF